MSASKAFKRFLFPFFITSVGRKTVMSLTGVGAIGFLVFHVLGNWVVFKGESAFNVYARTLHALPFLPLLEVGLAALFLAHLALGVILTFSNLAARPVPYAVKVSAGRQTFASTTMIYTGLIILAYMIFHVWTMSIRPSETVPAFDRVQAELTTRWCAALYLVALSALGIHVSHGASSALLSLGLRHPLHDPWLDTFGKIAAAVLAAGFGVIVLSFAIWGGPVNSKLEIRNPKSEGNSKQQEAKELGGANSPNVPRAATCLGATDMLSQGESLSVLPRKARMSPRQTAGADTPVAQTKRAQDTPGFPFSGLLFPSSFEFRVSDFEGRMTNDE